MCNASLHRDVERRHDDTQTSLPREGSGGELRLRYAIYIYAMDRTMSMSLLPRDIGRKLLALSSPAGFGAASENTVPGIRHPINLAVESTAFDYGCYSGHFGLLVARGSASLCVCT